MLWKLIYLLFGCDYIYWETSYNSGISRIRFTEEGVPYWKYNNCLEVLDQNTAKAYKVIFLTSSYEEYLGEEDGSTY